METQPETTTKTKRPQFNMLIDEPFMAKIKVIMEESGAKTTSEAIRRAVFEYARDLVPAYVQTKKEGTKRPAYETPEERMKAKMEQERLNAQAKAALEFEEKSNICKLLDGVALDPTNTGAFSCQYTLYEKIGKRVLLGSRTVPFPMLGMEHVELQFSGGTKEETLKALAKQNEKAPAPPSKE